MSAQITFVGRLGKDAELKQAGDREVLEFSAAVDSGYGEKKTTIWFKVSYWNKADKLLQYLTKGKQVFVAGELSLREYKTKDGESRTSAEVRANSIQLVGGKAEGDSPAQAPKPATPGLPPPEPETGEMPF